MDGLMAALALPLSGNPVHHIETWAAWHARYMVLAWGVLLPAGVLVARFFKVLPKQDWPRVLDHKAWWHAHRFLQYTGLALMGVGLWLIWSPAGPRVAFWAGTGNTLALWHGALGWLVCALGVLQLLGALARGSKGGPTDQQLRGDHYDMTPWRRAFERLHKGLGWLAVLTAVVVMALGLVLSDAPRWMALALLAWWLLLSVLFVHWQRAGRCIDTYQAIWGPGRQHPGNHLRPTGWGVRRPRG